MYWIYHTDNHYQVRYLGQALKYPFEPILIVHILLPVNSNKNIVSAYLVPSRSSVFFFLKGYFKILVNGINDRIPGHRISYFQGSLLSEGFLLHVLWAEKEDHKHDLQPPCLSLQAWTGQNSEGPPRHAPPLFPVSQQARAPAMTVFVSPWTRTGIRLIFLSKSLQFAQASFLSGRRGS